MKSSLKLSQSQVTLDQSRRIVHEQVNRSPSKQMYSFSKQERFGASKKSYCETPSYELGSTLNMRATNMGFGKKSDFTKADAQKPGPDRYTLGSAFKSTRELGSTARSGYTFSLGRDKISFRTIVTNKPVPGVGMYSVDPESQRIKQIYSMGIKTPNQSMTFSSRSNPGPAHYNLNGMNKTGFYFVSKFADSKASVFSPPSSKRFDDLRKSHLLPGPGTYNQEGIHGEGRYFNSKLQSAAGGGFSKQTRSKNGVANAENPGPGYYRVLSEFGDMEFPPIDPLQEKSALTRSLSQPSFSRKSTMQKQGTMTESVTTQHKKSQSNFYQAFTPNHTTSS